MASFGGLPIGSFSGRGADLSPLMQFLAMRREDAARAQAAKQFQAQQQQSALMALMQRQLAEKEMAQRGTEFQAAQQSQAAAREQDQQQFEAQQARIREAEQAQAEIARMAEKTRADEQARLLRGQLAREGEAKAEENRRLVSNKTTALTVAGLEERLTQHMNLLASAGQPADPVAALEAVTHEAMARVREIDDADAQAAAVAAVMEWKRSKEAEVLGRAQYQAFREDKEAKRYDMAEGRRLQARDRVRKEIDAENRQIDDELKDKLDELKDLRMIARGVVPGMNPEVAKAAIPGLEQEIADLRAKRKPYPVD